jgi:thiamine biosynthesis lipoprotein
MRETCVTRRRALLILAGFTSVLIARKGAAGTVEWCGTALGAEARIVLAGSDETTARSLLAECVAEADRLEEIFSLYRPSSEIARLNCQGFLNGASPELRQLLRHCQRLHALTGGLFDPTVQPLWRAYAEAGRSGRSRIDPYEVARAEFLGRIGMNRVQVSSDHVAMAEGTELTLNGIAQGYITDCIAEFLVRRGYRNVLIDLGEVRALGGHEDGRDFSIEWREVRQRLALRNAALAVSTADALVFPGASGATHIIHPRSGLTPRYWKSVAVRHPSATIADALSTALTLASPQEARRIMSRIPEAQAWKVAHND